MLLLLLRMLLLQLVKSIACDYIANLNGWMDG